MPLQGDPYKNCPVEKLFMEVACDKKPISELVGEQPVWGITVVTVADPEDSLH